MRIFAILEAPSALGLIAQGVELAPEALRRAGLGRGFGARIASRIEPQGHGRADDETGIRNAHDVATYATRLADAVGSVLDRGEFPIVLGGDCSILLGPALALRRRGRFGLFFVDGHADFYQPEADPRGEAASMELALIVGRGPNLLADLEGRRPLVRHEDVALLAHRDQEERARDGVQALPTELLAIDLHRLRLEGVEGGARRAVDHLQRADIDGFWVHLDVDAIDDASMPAVDYRMPGGLSWDEAAHVLGTALRAEGAVGFDLTIYNPRLDPEGTAANAIAVLVERVLRSG